MFKTDISAVEQNGILAFEFVPSEDLQVQRLPAVRENPFLDYKMTEQHKAADSKRSMLI